MFERVYPQMWISLDKKIRLHLIKVFGIPVSGVNEVMNNTVVSDGVTVDDLKAISKEKMVEYVHQDGEYSKLFELCLLQVNKDLTPVDVSQETVINQALENGSITILPKKYCDTCESLKGRHRKGCPKYK